MARLKIESFGEYVRRLRIEKGLNQTELAAKVKLDSAGLSKVENGKKALKEDKLILLSDALQIDLDQIKEQYFSEKFAGDCYLHHCPETVFKLAEEKSRYYKSINVEQVKLNF